MRGLRLAQSPVLAAFLHMSASLIAKHAAWTF